METPDGDLLVTFEAEALPGGAFLEAVKKRMRREYDYVLIDSRTGVSDTSGICTVQLPDLLVVCFTLNDQSIEGAAAVARAVTSQRNTATASSIKVFPVPTRVEKAEKDRLDPIPGDKPGDYRKRAMAALERIPDVTGSDPFNNRMYLLARATILQEMYKDKKFDQMEAIARPLMAFGAGGMVLFISGLQLLANQFGYDRAGFRAYVLCPAARQGPPSLK